METLELYKKVNVFGHRVKTFPVGIGDAFDSTVVKIEGFDRPFYGISFMEEKEIAYTAAAEEIFPGEARKVGYDTFTIEKGSYAADTFTSWPCVEWYKDYHVMLCCVKLKS